jgi:hypothetical protein
MRHPTVPKFPSVGRLGDTPVQVIAPAVLTQSSIAPSSGAAGTIFTVTPATYSGSPTPLRAFRLLLGAVDVTSLMVGWTYTSDAAGTLTWEEFAVNAGGTAEADPSNATVTVAGGAQPDKPAANSWTLVEGEEEAVLTVLSLPAGAATIQYENAPGEWITIAEGANTITGLIAYDLFTTRLRGVSAGADPGPPSDPKSCTPYAVIVPFAITVASGRARFDGTPTEIVVQSDEAWWQYLYGEPGGGGGGGGGGGETDPGTYTPDALDPAQTSWTVDAQISDDPGADLQVTVASAEAIQIGRHADGSLYIHNPASRAQPFTITFSQLSSLDGARWKDGTCLGQLLEAAQGFDSFVTTTDTDVPYSHTLNIDPGATGSPITFSPGETGTVLKAISLAAPDPDGRPKLEYVYPITVLATLPPANSFRAAPLAITKTMGIGRADLNLALLPNLALVAGGPDVETTRRKYLLYANATNYKQPKGERITAQAAENTYRSNNAAENARAIMLCASDIDPDAKADIALGLVQRGLDVVAHLRNGGKTFQISQSGLGGVYPGYKALVAFAAVLLEDSTIADLCDPALQNFVEDVQIHTVTQAYVDLYDYLPEDLGMPEWNMNVERNKAGITRAMDKRYRSVFNGHLLGQTMAARVIPGMRATWAHQPMFDYADRMNILTCYADPLSQVAWALVNSNKPDAFAQNFQAAYRDRPECGARWSWS